MRRWFHLVVVTAIVALTAGLVIALCAPIVGMS